MKKFIAALLALLVLATAARGQTGPQPTARLLLVLGCPGLANERR